MTAGARGNGAGGIGGGAAEAGVVSRRTSTSSHSAAPAVTTPAPTIPNSSSPPSQCMAFLARGTGLPRGGILDPLQRRRLVNKEVAVPRSIGDRGLWPPRQPQLVGDVGPDAEDDGHQDGDHDDGDE